MATRLGLGTVQFGMPYGVANAGQGVPYAQVSEILAQAQQSGIETLDTATLYGGSEAVLGRYGVGAFRVVTKTPRFAAASITARHAQELRVAFERSLSLVGCDRLDGLLAHHAADLLAPGGNLLWQAMTDLRQRGLVQAIGASVYDGGQIDRLLQCYEMDLVQLPLNVLDQRLLRGGQLAALNARGTKVHARSVFLQGLLLMDPDCLPAKLAHHAPVLQRVHTAAAKQGLSVRQAALAFVRDLGMVDVVLIGVASPQQLADCICDFRDSPAFDADALTCDDAGLVNPALW